MKMKILTPDILKAFGVAVIVFVCASRTMAQNAGSVQRKTIDGKEYKVHQIQGKDTYYQLSRIYDIPVKQIIEVNNKKDLRVGDTALIPTVNEAKKSNGATSRTNAITPIISAEIEREEKKLPTFKNVGVLTNYKVGPKETLYSISKKFQTTVNDLKIFNALTTDIVKEGQSLRIPDGKVPAPEAEAPLVPEPTFVPSEKSRDLTKEAFETNRYGIREKSEKGIAIWMENLETRNNSNLALHKTAPVGTILKITNPITKSVTYAKVVGKFAENSETHQAIVVLSKSAANHIGARDKRFLIEINYGLPLE